MKFETGEIDDVIVRQLRQYTDHRGWLLEFFRHDELPPEFHPVMGYISMTKPGVARGPHEHHDQADLFVFYTSTFKLYLWDARPASKTHRRRQVITTGQENPTAVVVPAGVVHAYQNVGKTDGVIVNVPNRLYAGPNRKEPVDEIRHEDMKDSPYRLDPA